MSHLTERDIEEIRERVNQERAQGFSANDLTTAKYVRKWGETRDKKYMHAALKEVEKNVKRRSLHREMRRKEERKNA